MSPKGCSKIKSLVGSGVGETYCRGLFFSSRAFAVNSAFDAGVCLVVCAGREDAEYFTGDLYNISPCAGEDIFFLPSQKESAQKSSYKASISVQRTTALHSIFENKLKRRIIVTFPEALSDNVPSGKKMMEPLISFSKCDEIPFESISELLFGAGFEKVDFVSSPGEFAVRGGIIDIFSFSRENPYRVCFFGDEVDSISEFNYNNQLSIGKLDRAEVFPDLSGCEQEETMISVTDVLPKDTVVFLDSTELYCEEEFYSGLSAFRKVFFQLPRPVGAEAAKEIPEENIVDFHIKPQPVFSKNFDLLSNDIDLRVHDGYKVYILGQKQAQIDRLRNILQTESIVRAELVADIALHEGFIDEDEKICWYTEHQIFDRYHRTVIKRTIQKSEQLTLNDLNSFTIGDYIVHIDYGVGIFGGLVRKKDDYGRPQELIKIIYKDDDVVFLSVHSLHKISRYKGKDETPPKIYRLGSKVWQSLKTSTKKKVKDIAADLISLYARRRATKGHAFPADNYLQAELESSFMYEDTPDQQSATEAVKADMEAECPMDRLICGDVGFGKTEIAIRAAFKAACDSTQVAVLVPTTILALQHYNTFVARLKNFPVNIDYVSRLRTAKEISDIKKRLENGTLDIVIGTHKLLSKDFNFKNLGLLVIDEEQKFGVSAKEKLRQLKLNVDTLTLTATPIPRTLQFSLLGARDLSIISTPPSNRIPVQTEIISFDRDEIASIISYELKRGGQVFFLHNKVHELEGIRAILQGLVPDMKICVAHGQMEPKVLEDKILSFMSGEYDLLLCTTIIENGLDIPNANTIIINQAQNFGLSDLHQLRGRVGRSNKRSFCYLIVPPLAGVTEDARRRLKAIEAFSDLGSGFNIAMQDLDIRGAGNLLGAEQSGFITEMGFETYQKVLAEALDELGIESGLVGRGQPARPFGDHFSVDTTVELDAPALIPDSYLDITQEKIRIYKEMDSLKDEKSLSRYAASLEDRFGKMPQELARLFDVMRLRNLGQKLGFEKIIVKNGLLIATFISNKMSSYYQSKTYERIMDKVMDPKMNGLFEFKMTGEKLRLVARGIVDTTAALERMGKLL